MSTASRRAGKNSFSSSRVFDYIIGTPLPIHLSGPSLASLVCLVSCLLVCLLDVWKKGL